jgi:hypothetical protein
MVNSDELIGTIGYLTVYTSCRINRCCYNRVLLYLTPLQLRELQIPVVLTSKNIDFSVHKMLRSEEKWVVNNTIFHLAAMKAYKNHFCFVRCLYLHSATLRPLSDQKAVQHVKLCNSLSYKLRVIRRRKH